MEAPLVPSVADGSGSGPDEESDGLRRDIATGRSRSSSDPATTPRASARIGSGDGDLREGVRARLAAVDCVAGVDRADVSGLRPALNDVRVRVVAEIRVSDPLDGEGDEDADRDGAVAAALESGFGVRAVESVESLSG